MQPPGDSVARAAIIDAMAVGCIPVLLHPAQLALWPWHWAPNASALLFDWTQARRQDARATLRALLEMPRARVDALRAAGARDVARLTYRGAPGGPGHACGEEQRVPDAVETLVQGLLSGRPVRRPTSDGDRLQGRRGSRARMMILP